MPITLHPITIRVPESTYNAAKEKAESLGYFSVEEYLSDWLEGTSSSAGSRTSDGIAMTAEELAATLEVGLADLREGRVMTMEEHDRQFETTRNAWIEANSK